MARSRRNAGLLMARWFSAVGPLRGVGVRRAVASVCLLLLIAGFVGVPVYVRPQVDPLQPADAILILGGADSRRYSFGLELGAAGWAPTVVLSNPYGAKDEWLTELCATPQTNFELDCFVPDPPTTRGEAQELHRLAAQHQWHRVIVVTYTLHISRARYIVGHCFDGELTMVASPTDLSLPEWAFGYAYQTAGFLKAIAQQGC